MSAYSSILNSLYIYLYGQSSNPDPTEKIKEETQRRNKIN